MSRTYRLKKAKHLIEELGVLQKRVWNSNKFWDYYWVPLEPKSKEGKEALARLHSDAKHSFYKWKGPSWFHNMYAQRPYRRNCKKQIRKYIRDPDYEIQIRNKPYREYWD